ncbi:MAG: hypothetical protein ACAH80_05110, partial [Alphaproteobacteria bacterium]
VSAVITLSIPKSTCACLTANEVLTRYIDVSEDASGNEIKAALVKKLEGLNVMAKKGEKDTYYDAINFYCPKFKKDAASDQPYSCTIFTGYSTLLSIGWKIDATVKPGVVLSDVKVSRAFKFLGLEF